VLLALAMVALLGGVARAEDELDPDEWVLLGTSEVVPNLVISLSPEGGLIDQLAIVASAGALTLDKVDILANHSTLERLMATSLDQTSTTKLIDLERPRKKLARVTLRTSGVSKGAEIMIYGHLSESATVASTVGEQTETTRAFATPRKVSTARRLGASDADGWTLLGEDEVDLIDDEVEINRGKSTWSQLKVVVIGDAVKLTTLDVHLGGKKPKVQREEPDQTYGEGDDSFVIDIAGKRRAIEKVRLQYRKHSLDAVTRIQVYAR